MLSLKIFFKDIADINQFVANFLILYPLKTSEN